jgi:TolB-like protein
MWQRWRSALSIALPAAVVVALVAWSFWPQPAAPAATASAPLVVVRVPAADSIGAGAGPLATAMSAAIQTSLVRAGVSVVANAPAAADSTNPASFVVHTTVQRAGSKARAQVRLFGARGDSSLWADQLDFASDQSFAAQDSISARVVRAVQTAVSRVRVP